ncbi:MAG TPA: tRNA glutamyl-Q(34) synthetase GluQRS [Chromatiales bacterium]|nr:tRNA glutamyl-Q(34) synthetase GluQRS [Thiotrichales bacterium]HIP68271.1 tRNA glutamyl-Q(34) synthetase GluQRS [Chromatiales bacterium]
MTEDYIGRFAPSPTGPLHIGSLVAAVGSYLQAKSKNGKWLVRIEDLDPPREEPGAIDKILRSLEAHGLHWDGEIVYQSRRHEVYEAAIKQLIENNFAYSCTCSRKKLKTSTTPGKFGLIYPGSCRNKTVQHDQKSAIRVLTHNRRIDFFDKRTGEYGQQLESEIGDFIIKRADGFFAYQLAVVIDDAWQKITEVVRGEDLLDNTPRQIHLQKLLDFPTPDYCHLPVVKNELGQKLSKQTHAPALDDRQVAKNLVAALKYLGLQVLNELQQASPEEILAQAARDWKHYY